MMLKIAIIGAGLAGRVLAWRLNEFLVDAGQHLSTTISLVDEQDRHFIGTGLVAAAMVAPYSEAVSTEAVTQDLGVHSYTLWGKWLPQLEAQTGHTIRFNRQGSLVVAHAQDDANWQHFHIKARAVVEGGQMQWLDHQSLKILEPELAQVFSKGLYFPNEGVINNQALYPALNHYFEQAEIISWQENCKVNDIEKLATEYDFVFDCRGNGAKNNLVDFRSVRGEVARVYAPDVDIKRAIRLIHPRFPLYIAPRDNHEYIVGATQIESDADTPVTVRSGLELLSALYSLHPGFGEANILQLLVGLRPTFSTNLPQININESTQTTSINGLYRHGYLFVPVLIEDVIRRLFTTDKNILFPQFIKTNPTISAKL